MPKQNNQAELPKPSVVSVDRLAEFAITAADAALAAGGGFASFVLRQGIPAVLDLRAIVGEPPAASQQSIANVSAV